MEEDVKRKPKFSVGQVVRITAMQKQLNEFVKIRRVNIEEDGRPRYFAPNYMLGGLPEQILRPLTKREIGKP